MSRSVTNTLLQKAKNFYKINLPKSFYVVYNYIKLNVGENKIWT